MQLRSRRTARSRSPVKGTITKPSGRHRSRTPRKTAAPPTPPSSPKPASDSDKEDNIPLRIRFGRPNLTVYTKKADDDEKAVCVICLVELKTEFGDYCAKCSAPERCFICDEIRSTPSGHYCRACAAKHSIIC